MSNSTVPPEIRALLDDVRDALSVTVDTMALDNLSRLESLYLEQLQEIERREEALIMFREEQARDKASLSSLKDSQLTPEEARALLEDNSPSDRKAWRSAILKLTALRALSTKGTAEK